MTLSTDWKKVLEDNREAIEQKMIELHREWEGNNQDVHEGLGIESDGTLYTWTFIGDYGEPEAIWNGTDFKITIFNTWNWTDNDDIDWEQSAMRWAEDEEEKEKLRKRFEEEDEMSISEILLKEFSHIYKDIAEDYIDTEMDDYRGCVSGILDNIIANID